MHLSPEQHQLIVARLQRAETILNKWANTLVRDPRNATPEIKEHVEWLKTEANLFREAKESLLPKTETT